MYVEARLFRNEDGSERRMLVLCANTQHESNLLDWAFGETVGDDFVISNVSGEVRLGDGEAPLSNHYIRLEKND